ncbi:uncharacterized protein [Antedon mediterranea]|uniref:uncharacterized protein n=1 Tax=Antedon mediterranea TaxID=105859 RepID=UPI003AF58C27
MAASNDEEELGLDEKDSLSTKHVVTSSVNILNEYCKAKGSSVACIEKFTAPQLNAFLRSFFGEVKRSNGELYAKRSMITLRYGLQKHFKKVKTIDIVNDSQFKQANEMYQTVLMQIKLSGKGCGSPKDPISKEDFLKIKASSALNVNTPRGLQNKVFVDLMLHLCNNSLSSRRNLRSFLKTDFAMTSDSSTNQRYVYFAQTKDDSGRMYETCLPDCPVAAYCKYTSHLDPANDTFWQRPKNTVLDNNVVWYNNMPLGKNTLGAKMHNICREAGTSKIYTNSCLRATTIHALGNEGFAPRHIMSISGHKSEASIKHYVQRSMSLCLSDKFNNSASSTPVCTISPTAGPCYRTPTAGPSYLTPTAGPSYLTPTTTLETSQSTHQDVNNMDHVNRSRVIVSLYAIAERERTTMAESGCNFALLSDEDIARLHDDAPESSNTKKQIKYAVSRLEAFAIAVSTTLADVESLDTTELDCFLSRFYGGLRRDNGELYTRKTMHAIRYGLGRHFMAEKCVDITQSWVFKESDKTYKAMLVKLKKLGKGGVRHKQAVTEDDMKKILDSLDLTTPEGLQNKVFIDIMIRFGNCGRENLRGMSISDFFVEVDDKNLRYIVHRDNMTKSRCKNDPNKDCSGHMHEIPGSNRCPVSSFLALKKVLNPDMKCMWQRPRFAAPNDGTPWYIDAPLGVNTLGSKMKTISEKAGCLKKYTNHSLKATTCTILHEAEFPNRHIMPVTGTSSSVMPYTFQTSRPMFILHIPDNNPKMKVVSSSTTTIAPKINKVTEVVASSNDGISGNLSKRISSQTEVDCKVQSSELSKKAKLDHGTTVTDEQFKNVLSEVSLWYDRRPYINWLKVLYQDHVASNFELDNATKMIELLNLLIDSGDLSPSNLTLIYDTIKATKQFGLVEKLKRLIPSCPNVRDIVLSKFSCHRQQVVMLGMVLRQADVAKISECYNDPVKEYVDVWNLIMDLEHRRVICEGKMESFIEKLKTLQVPLAVEALTKGNSETSSLATTSTKSNSGEVMPNNRDESSTTSMTSNSDQVMSKDPNESTKFNQMVKTSVKRKVQSSELSKKAKLDHESSNDLVIGSSASEDSSDYSDYDDNDDVDYDDDDIAVNNDLNKEMPSGQTAGSPQQPPCRTPYTNEPSTHGQPTCELPVQQTAAHCLPVAQQPPTHCLPVAQQPPTDFLPVAQQPPTHCLPVAQQPPMDFLPVAQQQPMDWLPVAQQPSMDYLPVAQQPPTQCLPVAQKRPIHCLPVAQESPVQEKLLNVKREVESDESSQNLVFLPVKSEFGNLLCSEEEPFTEIIEEPKQRDFRFYKVKVQYEEKSISKNKSFPTIQVNNYTGSVRVVVSLVTNETGTSKPIPHPYGLVGKDCENGICKKFVPNAGQPIKFEHLGVQRIKQDEIFSALLVRLNQGVNPFKNFQLTTTDRKKLIGLFDLTVVCLCFQVYLVQEAGETVPLAPVVSQPIFDKNYPAVIQIDRRTGFARGGDKVFILCSKIQRDDIAVKFFDADWSEFAQVNPSDIHRRVAIVCTTPPYKDGNITEPKQVYFKLIRPSDNGGSQAVSFTYIPNNENFEQKS